MDLKTLIKMFFLHLAVIYGMSMLVSLIWCAVEVPDKLFPISFLWEMLLFSLGADLPLFVFYSRSELSSKHYKIRVIIHACLLEAILLPFGYFIGLWHGIGGFLVFFFVVLAVDAAVTGLTYLNTKTWADKINAAIKERRQNNKEDEDDD